MVTAPQEAAHWRERNEVFDQPVQPITSDRRFLDALEANPPPQSMGPNRGRTLMKEIPERRAIVLLQEIVDMDRADSDALPGSVVKLVKKALTILKKRRRG